MSRIDPRTNRVVKTFDAGSEPNGLLHAFGPLWVGDYGGGKLLRIDPATGRILQRWPNAHANWITASARNALGVERGREDRPHRPCDGRGEGDGQGRRQPARDGVDRRRAVGAEHRLRLGLDRRPGVEPGARHAQAGFGPASVVLAGGAVWVGDTEDGDIWRLPPPS